MHLEKMSGGNCSAGVFVLYVGSCIHAASLRKVRFDSNVERQRTGSFQCESKWWRLDFSLNDTAAGADPATKGFSRRFASWIESDRDRICQLKR